MNVRRGFGRFCSRHCYAQWTRNKAAAAFWDRLVKQDNGCWFWPGHCNRGYGRVGFNGRDWITHRLAFTLAYGPIPAGLLVCHSCDANYPVGDITYRRCCNPDHLFLGTVQDNNRDMWEKGRGPLGDRHPARTHPDYLARGDDHWSRRMPDRRATGDRNASRRHPERVARGVRHGTHTHPETRHRGEKNGQSKLTADEVRSIRSLYGAGGMTQEALGKRFHVSETLIANIVHRRAWRHIE